MKPVCDVTVVVPVFNHAAYVTQALDSVLAQTRPPRRLVIIDDGSSDGSVGVVEAWLSAHPAPEGCEVIFRARANRGAAATLNEGFALADTEFVAILNSDDLYEPDRLERCLAAARERGCDFIVTYVEPIDSDGRPLAFDHPWRMWYADGRLNEIDVLPSFAFTLLFGNIAVTTGTFFIGVAFACEIGPFRDFRYAHDLDYLLRASAVQEPAILREPLYRYRLHATNTIRAPAVEVEAECAAIYRDFFRATAGGCRNPLAPTLDRYIATLGAMPLPRALARALDALIESGPPGTARHSLSPRPSPPATGAREVVLIGHELSRTGAPVLLFDIARELALRGNSPRLVAPKDGPLREDIEVSGLRAEVSSPRLRKWAERFVRFARPDLVGGAFASLFARAAVVCRFLAERDPRLRPAADDPVLVNSASSLPLASTLLRGHRGRLVWYIHETVDPRMILRTSQARAAFEGLVRRPGAALVFGSQATREAWGREGFEGVVRYWSGVPRRHGNNPPAARRERRVVLSVGTSGPRKGTGDLIEAFAAGIASGAIGDDVDLCIVGCQPPSLAPLTRDLLRRVWSLNLGDRIRLVESVAPDQLDGFYQEASVYVQASIMECLPLALLTAMSHGLPIVTSDAGGCPEAVVDGESGLVVPSRSPARLLAALCRLLDHPEEAARLGLAARSRFDERFCLEVTAGPLLDLLLAQD